jgi:hypothetical protein
MFVCYFFPYCGVDSSFEGSVVNFSHTVCAYLYSERNKANDTTVHLTGDFRQDTEFFNPNN